MRRIVSAPAILLDELRALYPDSSKTTLRQLLQNRRVRVNGDVEKDAKRQLDPGDRIEVLSKSDERWLPEGLSILHEDTDVIVVLKANGLLTVATERERENTAQAYLNAYLGARHEERIHVVHRLDRGTSGLMVVAKHDAAHQLQVFQRHLGDVRRLQSCFGKVETLPPLHTVLRLNRKGSSEQQRRKKEERKAKAGVLHIVLLIWSAVTCHRFK